MALTVATLVYTLLLVYVLHKVTSGLLRYIRTCRVASKIPGFPDTQLIKGDLDFDTGDEYIEKTMNFVHKTNTKMHRVWVSFIYPYYALTHPDTAKVVLKSANVPKSSNLGSPYLMLQPWIGEGLLVHVGGKHWERNRHLLTPAFHFDILKGYIDVFNAVADDLLVHLSKCRYGSVEIWGAVKVATLDALLRCAFSYQGRIQEQGFDHPYVTAVRELAKIVVHRISSPLTYPDFIFWRTRQGKRFYQLCDYVHEFSDSIIAARKHALSSDKKVPDKKYRDFLDILLLSRDEEGRGLTDLEIRAEADSFLFAGHDTTSSALGSAIFALAKYPDVQEKVYKEVKDVIGNRQVEWEDLEKLKYMLCFIKEVMRMYTTVPVIVRGLLEPTLIDGHVIPAGTPIEINIHAINHRPDVWHDHDTFRPERFLGDDTDRDPFCFIPFSAGSRNCIGQNFALNELRVVLSRLVQAYRIELDPCHEVEMTMSLVIQTKTGVRVFLKSRR